MAKALSIRQPWAWLIVTGEKGILKNRIWATRYRGPLLVHVGRSWAILINDVEKQYKLSIPRDELLRGVIVGVVELIDIVTTHGSVWFDGTGYGWVLRNPQPLPFKAMNGSLALFEVDMRPFNC